MVVKKTRKLPDLEIYIQKTVRLQQLIKGMEGA